METYRIAVRNHHAILDIDVHVAISDLESVDKLADVYVCDARVLVGVRVVPDLVGHTLRLAGQKNVVDEDLGDVYGVHLGVHGGEAVGANLVR